MSSADVHIPVLLNEAIDALNLSPNKIYLDATFGGGGYSKAILENGCVVHAIDRDPDAKKRAEVLLKKYPKQFFFYQGLFSEIQKIFPQDVRFDGVVFDFGMSSYQLNEGERGFSFRIDGPLDMRMSFEKKLTAETVVNTFKERDLADIIYVYGEGKNSFKIANAIIKRRALSTIKTTKELAEIICSVVKNRKSIDPATKTFQALRIFINDELMEIKEGLNQVLPLVKEKGRIVTVAFHSLEDRIVKLWGKDCKKLKTLIKNVIMPSLHEIKNNPRSRSARMRIFEVLNGDV
ncbi:MAG: 16S rRNA (cytosine(1402)-N(4))-methyltransferase RsmH [Alphaproteobacteria bacterium]